MFTDPLDWRLALVDVAHFSEASSLADDVVPSAFGVGADALLDEAEQTLTIPVRVEVLETEDAPEPLAQVDVACVFQFRDLAALRDADGHVRLARPLVVSALGIALSTARGVLVGRARHPLFSHHVLPIRSPRDEFDKLISLVDKPWIAAE